MTGRKIEGSKLPSDGRKVVTKVDEPKILTEENKLLKGNEAVQMKVTVENGKITGDAEENIDVGDVSKKGNKVSDNGSGKRKDSTAESKPSTSPNNAPAKTIEDKKSKKAKVCMEDCVKGPKSGCPIKMRRHRDGHLSCVEIHEMLVSMGIEDPRQTSKCVRAAIMKGLIKITGNPEEMEMIICEGKCEECSLLMKAKLKDLLMQPDYGGSDYEDGCLNATVRCEGPECEGASYVTNICTGNPQFDNGKFHNHCGLCPGFGVCINDYRMGHCTGCNTNQWFGCLSSKCPKCGKRDEDSESNDSNNECVIM